jgi:hypothetical protein
MRATGSGRPVFLGAAVAVLVVLLVRNRYLFTSRIYEDGDAALNSLLVQRAERLQLLIGNYSRVGFHHPGPAFLYLLAAGQAVFHDLLHVVPSPYGGQVLGDLFFAAALVGWIVLIVYRVTGSGLAAGASFATVLWFAGAHSLAGDLWFPYLYSAVFLLLVVSGAALAAGRTAELPAFVLAAGFLVHGHVSFVLFVAVTAAVAGAGWWLAHRRGHQGGDRRGELGAHRRQVRISLVLVGLFLLAPALQTALHFPGPWPDYLHYAGRRDGGGWHPLGVGLRYLAWYWSGEQVPLVVTVLAAVGGAVLLVSDRDPARRRFFRALFGMLAVESGLFLIYLLGGVDELVPKNRYVGFFYLGVPLLLVLAGAAQLGARARDLGRLAPVAVSAAAAVVAGMGVAGPAWTSPYRGVPGYPAAVAALASSPDRAAGPITVSIPRHDDWALAAGLVLEATRRHLPICVQGAEWTNLFTGRYVCPARHAGWPVQVRSTLSSAGGGPVPAGSRVVWSGPSMVVVTRP